MKISVRRNLLAMFLILAFLRVAQAQGSAGTDGDQEPRYLIDIPTAGMLRHGAVAFDLNFFQDGGVLVGAHLGVFDRVLLGLSYGGSQLLGDKTAVANPGPGVEIRIRFIEEGTSWPALVLGLDSQGKEAYVDTLDRYTIRSPGVFIAASRNFSFAGFLSFHGGVNTSLEVGARKLSFFLGAEKTIGSSLSAVIEYNHGSEEASPLNDGYGYLNIGLRCSLGSGLTLSANLKDLTRNGDHVSVGNRTISLEYVGLL
jgi:hypothetical protein